MVDKDWLAEHAEGLILLSGAREGDIGKALLKGNRELAERELAFYQRHFAGHYYLELQRNNFV